MSVNDNHSKNTPGSTPSGVIEDLNIAIEKLDFVEEMLRQLQKIAQNMNEVSLNYYLEMAILETEQRAKNNKTQRDWLAEE